MTNQAGEYILKRRAGSIGVKEFARHDLRRTFAGADISTVHKLMGYSNANITARYEHRDVKAK